MSSLSYGIRQPHDLLEKLNYESVKLIDEANPYDVFNFIITAAVLREWINQIYKDNSIVKAISQAFGQKSWELFPSQIKEWIIDIPGTCTYGPDIRLHVMNMLNITWHGANASKHYHWGSSSNITDIQSSPIVKGWYHWFSTSRQSDIYVECDGYVYGIKQIYKVLSQFFAGLLQAVDDRRNHEKNQKI